MKALHRVMTILQQVYVRRYRLNAENVVGSDAAAAASMFSIPLRSYLDAAFD